MNNTSVKGPPVARREPAAAPRHRDLDWRAAIACGVVAGLVFMMVEMLMVWLVMGQSPWGPPRMIAAMALGTEILPPPADFSLKAMVVAMMIHLPMSALLGVVIGWLVKGFDKMAAIALGLFAGLGVYVVNFYVVAPMLFPWFVEAQNWISAFAHAVFGALAAGVYVAMRRETR